MIISVRQGSNSTLCRSWCQKWHPRGWMTHCLPKQIRWQKGGSLLRHSHVQIRLSSHSIATLYTGSKSWPKRITFSNINLQVTHQFPVVQLQGLGVQLKLWENIPHLSLVLTHCQPWCSAPGALLCLPPVHDCDHISIHLPDCFQNRLFLVNLHV